MVRELFQEHPPPAGSAVWFAGAGTGQMFDFVAPDFLRPFSITFTDIHSGCLRQLEARLRAYADLRFRALADDIENSALAGPFALVVAVLVLEHVDVARAITAMCQRSSRVFVITQENPPHLASAMTREAGDSMKVFREIEPHLVQPAEVEACFAEHGFRRAATISRSVPDAKRMVGVEFRQAQ